MPEKEKRVSRTGEFQAYLAKILSEKVGKKVSKAVAWNTFKAMVYCPYTFLAEVKDSTLPLSGLGTFALKEGANRNTGDTVVRPKFYPSTVIKEAVLNSNYERLNKVVLGDSDEEIEEEAPAPKKAPAPAPKKAPAPAPKKAPAPAPKKELIEEEEIEELEDDETEDPFDI